MGEKGALGQTATLLGHPAASDSLRIARHRSLPGNPLPEEGIPSCLAALRSITLIG